MKHLYELSFFTNFIMLHKHLKTI